MTEGAPELVDGSDPLEGDPRLPQYFGPAFGAVEGFHRMLVRDGVLRGLVGPREVPRLWGRHILNSAAVVPFLPATGTIIDLGSGAGLPGIVVAAMRPDANVVLLEPMERRTDWLREVSTELRLDNVTVLRGRAQDVVSEVEGDAVTVRAVASLDKLYRWALPLLKPGGILVALKGEKAEEEIEAARHVGRKLGARQAEIVTAPTIDGVEVTRVVRVVREAGSRVR